MKNYTGSILVKVNSFHTDYFFCASQTDTELVGYYFVVNYTKQANEIQMSKRIPEKYLDNFAASFDVKAKRKLLSLILSKFNPQ